MSWPVPDGPCCDDYLPCYCHALNFDDYDHITQQREEALIEIERFENASPETLRLYHEGKLRWADIVRPTPPIVRRYSRTTWRTSDKIEDVVDRVCEEVARTGQGTRNNTLASAAFFFGKLVQGGTLDVEHAAYRLGQAARAARLPLHEAATTVRLGLQAGMRKEATSPYVNQRPAAMGRGGAPAATTSW